MATARSRYERKRARKARTTVGTRRAAPKVGKRKAKVLRAKQAGVSKRQGKVRRNARSAVRKAPKRRVVRSTSGRKGVLLGGRRLPSIATHRAHRQSEYAVGRAYYKGARGKLEGKVRWNGPGIETSVARTNRTARGGSMRNPKLGGVHSNIPGLSISVSGWRQFKYGYEVPKSVRKSQFDYLDDAESQDGFFKDRGTWHHTSNFMRTSGDLAKAGWHGIENYGFTNGLLIQISKDGERYRTGYYYTSEGGKTRTTKSQIARKRRAYTPRRKR